MILIVLIFFLVSLAYRIYGLWHNHPFWVDEFSSADQAKIILQHGLNVFGNKDILFDSHNITTHFLIALSFKLFGLTEFAARLPIAIVGAIVPVMVFIVARKLFGKAVAFSALLLITFSYFEITWSRQARSYMILQLCILATIYFYYSILEKRRKYLFYAGLAMSILFGLLTHYLYYIFIVSLIVHAVIFYRKTIPWKRFLPVIVLFAVGVFFLSFSNIYHYFTTSFTITNNLWYYHSFLWREYGLVTFLGASGLIMGYFDKQKWLALLLIHTSVHLLFIIFLFPPYVSRYLLPIFPYLIIGMSYMLVQIAGLLSLRIRSYAPHVLKILGSRGFLSICITLAIIANGHKFVTKPKQFYSVNHDFREIALVDYNQIYELIKEKGNLSAGKTAVIETWDARIYWYLSRAYPARYVFRWENEQDRVNGLVKRTDFIYNQAGEKVIPTDTGLRFIGDVDDLKKAMLKYPKGFIFIDDASLPADVREYAEQNFKKELYIDHYMLDDNPYSIWPATLYSWGF